MAQVIIRLDDELHAGLKRRARAEGRSMNALATEVLRRAVEGPVSARATLRARLRGEGRLVEPSALAEDPPDHAELAARLRQDGVRLSDLVESDRDGRG
jgi:plasmid stability protein